MSTRTLDERRQKAVSKWIELQDNPAPLIYIGAASCGLAAGAAEVQEAVEKYIKKNGIEGRIIQVGCIGPCYLEPLMDVQMPGLPRISYSNARPSHGPLTME